MEKVDSIKPLKSKQCSICGSSFVYRRASGVYCSNACKCKAYSIRTSNQSINSIKGINDRLPGKLKNDLSYIESRKNDLSIIDYQQKTITKLKAALDYVIEQSTIQFNQLKDLYEVTNNKLMIENKTLLNKLLALESENQSLRLDKRKASDELIGQVIKGVINLSNKKV